MGKSSLFAQAFGMIQSDTSIGLILELYGLSLETYMSSDMAPLTSSQQKEVAIQLCNALQCNTHFQTSN